MRYFIGYLFRDQAKEAIDRFRKDISEKFFVYGALKIAPHVTLVSPFETEDLSSLEAVLYNFAETRSQCELVFTGFNSFDEAIWFLDVEQKPELSVLKEEIIRAIQKVVVLPEQRKSDHFHCTLAYKDLSPEKFIQIGNYLQQKTLPIEKASFDAMTLFHFSDNRWTPFRTFQFRG